MARVIASKSHIAVAQADGPHWVDLTDRLRQELTYLPHAPFHEQVRECFTGQIGRGVMLYHLYVPLRPLQVSVLPVSLGYVPRASSATFVAAPLHNGPVWAAC
jgi:hypothetical protein